MGGVMSHAAVVAREFGVACVVDTQVAASRIPDGALVEVDGSAGTITVLEVGSADQAALVSNPG
ncbi:PEP-utilizing enzyme [Gordonia amicalis]|uniref:PEP-utilizing enzyme n=1 Tax=Gordonia amicalis TaxID=89053 RepID=UPI00295336C6|nr:PEP-utilizing enzyme [Gordonia amicalis]MDV7101230.1 PEP-utilizing enzyme [Gordonia amicalis]